MSKIKSKDENHKDPLDRFNERRDTAFKRYPLVFTLLGTFGLVSTLYGFQHLLDKVPLLANNPVVALAVGLVILFLTGSLYKKLG